MRERRFLQTKQTFLEIFHPAVLAAFARNTIIVKIYNKSFSITINDLSIIINENTIGRLKIKYLL